MSESSRQPNNGSDTSHDYTPVSSDTTDLYEVLKPERRRHTIAALHEHGKLDLRDLARRVAARERDVEPEDIEGGTYKSVYITLYQNHLPHLEEFGAINWDGISGDPVSATKETHDLRALMDTVSNSRVLTNAEPESRGLIADIQNLVSRK